MLHAIACKVFKVFPRKESLPTLYGSFKSSGALASTMERPSFIDEYLVGKPITRDERQLLRQYAHTLSERVRHSDHISMKWGVLRGVTNIVHDQLGKHSALLQNQQVIEIGPGCNPLAAFLLERIGVRKYVAVEPLRPELTERLLNVGDSRIILERNDGLTYLLQQPDESAIVMSFGVLDWTLFDFLPFNTDGISWSRQEIDDYMRLLVKEVYRVTPSGSITVNQPSGDGKVASFFDKVGFRRDALFNDMIFFKP